MTIAYEKTRTMRIEIDLPVEGAMPWVRAVLQTVFKDEHGNTVQAVDRTGYVHRSLGEFALQMQTIIDPITQQEVTLSGAAAANMISAFVSSWILTDIGGVLNENGDIVKE